MFLVLLIHIMNNLLIGGNILMDNVLLKIDNLTKSFKGQTVVNNVSLNVRKGKIYGLLGVNGAGKSIILKMIVGMLKPTSGKIIFKGHNIKRSDLFEIGSLIEKPALYNNLTAYENLKVYTSLLSIDEARIPEVLGIVGIQDTEKKLVAKFSLGMKQRLGIAVAIVSHPELLILDEPANGLDPLGIIELRQLIKSFSEKGITTITTSHVLSEISQLADDIGIINNGKLVYESENNRTVNLEKIFVEAITNK